MTGKAFMAKKLMEIFTSANCNGFGRVLSKVKVINGSQGSCTCELVIGEEHRNRQGYLHGGMTATLIDATSAAALGSLAGQSTSWFPGTGMQLNISYLKAAALGEEIIINARTLQVENNTAVITVDVKNKTNGTIIAQANQTRWKRTEI